MPDIRLVSAQDSAALLAFELDNARYFSSFVPSRPAEMLTSTGMTQAIDALVQEIEAGVGLYFVAYIDDQIIGRLNISFKEDRAEFGYRVSEAHCGKGFASIFVAFGLEQIAAHSKMKVAQAHALSSNPASMKVLKKCGFHQIRVEKDAAKDVGFDGDIVFFERVLN